MTRTDSPDLLLAFDAEAEHDVYSHRWSWKVEAQLLRLDEDGRPLGLVDFPEYDMFQAIAYAADDMGPAAYGFGVEFRGYMIVDLRRVEAQARTLRRVERRLERMSEATATRRYSPPADFGEYLARVAKVLGVKHFGYWGERRPNGRRDFHLLDHGAEQAAAWLTEAEANFFADHPAKPRDD